MYVLLCKCLCFTFIILLFLCNTALVESNFIILNTEKILQKNCSEIFLHQIFPLHFVNFSIISWSDVGGLVEISSLKGVYYEKNILGENII